MPTSTRIFLFRLTLVAFLFSAVVPFFAVYELPESPAQQEQLAGLFGEKILICTEKGFEWVALDDLRHGKHQPTPDSHLKCAMCYVSSKGGAHHQLGPAALALDMPLGQALRVHFAYRDGLSLMPVERPANPRAPPAFV